MSKLVRNLPTPEGQALGAEIARLVEPVITQLEQTGEPDKRCKTCAFRAGTEPNGCEQTVMDAMKCVMEGNVFGCHVEVGHVCHGWFAARVALKGETIKMPWEYSHLIEKDEQ